VETRTKVLLGVGSVAIASKRCPRVRRQQQGGVGLAHAPLDLMRRVLLLGAVHCKFLQLGNAEGGALPSSTAFTMRSVTAIEVALAPKHPWLVQPVATCGACRRTSRRKARRCGH